MNIDSIIPIIHPEKYQIYITVGLPGTGKSTFCEKMAELCPSENVKIISRDFWRTSLLWGTRKLEPKQRKKVEENMDDLTTDKVMEELLYTINFKPSVRIILIDGCHTCYTDLRWILSRIKRICFRCEISYEINLVLVGTPNSDCNHKLTDKKVGDYSDYRPNGKHTALPREVFEKKRKQYEALIQRAPFHDVCRFCQHVLIVPSYISQLALRESDFLGPDLPSPTPRSNLCYCNSDSE